MELEKTESTNFGLLRIVSNLLVLPQWIAFCWLVVLFTAADLANKMLALF